MDKGESSSSSTEDITVDTNSKDSNNNNDIVHIPANNDVNIKSSSGSESESSNTYSDINIKDPATKGEVNKETVDDNYIDLLTPEEQQVCACACERYTILILFLPRLYKSSRNIPSQMGLQTGSSWYFCLPASLMLSALC